MDNLQPLSSLSSERFEAPSIAKRLVAAGRSLAELKGLAASVANQAILINTLAIQEAKDSSEIENIVATHDELFKDEIDADGFVNAAAKEVNRYRQALYTGFEGVAEDGLLTINQIIEIQSVLEQNKAGFRKLPGTVLKDGAGNTVYTPPQNPDDILSLMADLERFINDPTVFDADPLIKMAIMHYQFESIHPFYDGNGRTGRIINILFLVKEGLLDIPILYISRYIIKHKAEYYRLLGAIREEDAWGAWVEYMLTAVEETAADTIVTVRAIDDALTNTKRRIRADYKFYSQDLLNNLFTHPYTKIEFLMRDLGVTRRPATKYLDELAEGGILEKRKIGRSNYYVNLALWRILTGETQ
ncbi:MAG: Fic family protein [Capsulimonadaceae bacterium]|nr:Fic family protein [Capsulimonadaceae bacterium]